VPAKSPLSPAQPSRPRQSLHTHTAARSLYTCQPALEKCPLCQSLRRPPAVLRMPQAWSKQLRIQRGRLRIRRQQLRVRKQRLRIPKLQLRIRKQQLRIRKQRLRIPKQGCREKSGRCGACGRGCELQRGGCEARFVSCVTKNGDLRPCLRHRERASWRCTVRGEVVGSLERGAGGVASARASSWWS